MPLGGLLVSLKEGKQPLLLDATNPEMNSLPVFPQLTRYLYFGFPLLIQLPF